MKMHKSPDELKIGILKFGKSTYFDPAGWKAIGADIEVRKTIEILSDFVGEIHFWGAYQLGKDPSIKSTLPNNLIFHDKKLFFGRDYDKLTADVEKVGLDALIVVNGPHSTNNRGLQMFERYVYPNLQIINRTNTPWLYLYSDPRYFLKARELRRAPQKILCQYPLKGQVKKVANVKIPMDYEFFDVSAFWRLGAPKEEYEIEGRENILRLIGNSKPGYWDEWNTSYIPELGNSTIPWEVWGIWHEAPATDDRFKQVSIKEGWDKLTKTKHLFILVTPSQLDGGYPITGRYWELAMTDALVWVNQHYDHLGQLIPLDHFTRVSNGKELAERIEQLENDPDKYKQLVEEQRARFKAAHIETDYLGAQFIKAIYDIVQNPSQEAFVTADLKPDESISYEQVDKSSTELANKALVFQNNDKTQRKILMGCAIRPYALLKKAFEHSPDQRITFEELCEIYKRDPYFAHKGKDHSTPRDHVAIACHSFSVLNYRGMPLEDATPLQGRQFPIDEVLAAMSTYVPIDRSRRSAGAKRAGSKVKNVDGTDQVDDSTNDTQPVRQRRVSAPRPKHAKLVPVKERILVAKSAVNPFRPNTATRVHFQEVIDAGTNGITFNQLAQRIEETKTQGVQTGERLAGWSFSIFPNKGLADVMIKDENGNLVPFTRPSKTASTVITDPLTDLDGDSNNDSVVQSVSEETEDNKQADLASVFIGE